MITLKNIGMAALSIVICFVLFAIVNGGTYLCDFVVGNILFVITFCIFARIFPQSFSWIGILSIIIVPIIIWLTDKGIKLYDALSIASIFFGSIIGLFWKLKSYKLAITFLVITGISITALQLFVYAQPTYEKAPNIKLSKIQKGSRFLKGHHGESPVFSEDTVYLINVSFLYCAPCRQKKKHLPSISKEFKNKPFKLIEIHSFESKAIFDSLYMLNNPLVYHDSLDQVAKLLGANSAPTEVIFNKKGIAVRKKVGFHTVEADQYLKETIKLIKELVIE